MHSNQFNKGGNQLRIKVSPIVRQERLGTSVFSEDFGQQKSGSGAGADVTRFFGLRLFAEIANSKLDEAFPRE